MVSTSSTRYSGHTWAHRLKSSLLVHSTHSAVDSERAKVLTLVLRYCQKHSNEPRTTFDAMSFSTPWPKIDSRGPSHWRMMTECSASRSQHVLHLGQRVHPQTRISERMIPSIRVSKSEVLNPTNSPNSSARPKAARNRDGYQGLSHQMLISKAFETLLLRLFIASWISSSSWINA